MIHPSAMKLENNQYCKNASLNTKMHSSTVSKIEKVKVAARPMMKIAILMNWFFLSFIPEEDQRQILRSLSLELFDFVYEKIIYLESALKTKSFYIYERSRHWLSFFSKNLCPYSPSGIKLEKNQYCKNASLNTKMHSWTVSIIEKVKVAAGQMMKIAILMNLIFSSFIPEGEVGVQVLQKKES